MKVYVASSWRNALQPAVVLALREAGHEVYDFRNPAPGNHGFAWSQIDPAWQTWSPATFRAALGHPIAAEGFGHDMRALRSADATVLVLPCGRSAHLELGWAAGHRQRTAVLIPEPCEPELMYSMLGAICTDIGQVVSWLRTGQAPLRIVERAPWAGDLEEPGAHG